MTAPSMHQTKPRNMPALLRTYFLMSCWLLCSSHTFQNSYINIHLLVVPIITVQAMVIRIPLPGGRSISFNQDTGVLRIQTAGDIIADMQVPDMGAIPSENVLDSITVKDTRTEKGFGAFCGEYDAEAKDNSNFSGQIPKKSFLGFYEGEIIRSREELDKIAKGRDAKSGYMDYVMSLDGGVTFMDGYERAQDRSKFSPVHLNHADKGTTACNVIRLLEDDRVAFFSSRDIFAGEELCFDYGSNFWKGREHLIV